MSTPSIVTSPSVGRSSAPIKFSKVDLPDPDGPAKLTNSPAAISRSTPFSALTGTASVL